MFPLVGANLGDHLKQLQVLLVVPGALAGFASWHLLFIHSLKSNNNEIRTILEMRESSDFDKK